MAATAAHLIEDVLPFATFTWADVEGAACADLSTREVALTPPRALLVMEVQGGAVALDKVTLKRLLKFWFHLSKNAQRKRLMAIESDPETSWRVTKRDWDFFEHYDRFYRISEDTLRETSTADAPWILVEGTDPRYRYLTVGNVLLEAMRKRLAAPVKRRRVTSTATCWRRSSLASNRR